jgi:putative hemolysin
MLALGRVPRTGDIFERGPFRFEIVDMDGNRVDRLLVARTPPPRGAAAAETDDSEK